MADNILFTANVSSNIIFKTLLIKGEAGNNIANIEKTGTNVLVDTYTITLTDGTTTTFTVTNGRAIANTELTSTTGLADTYTITYNDNTTSTFTVTNGRAIYSIAKTGTNVLVDTYTITYNDGTTSTFNVTNGRGISNIAKTDTVGVVDTYTITYNDNTTSTFDIKNGIDNTVPTNGIIAYDGNDIPAGYEETNPPAGGGVDFPIGYVYISTNSTNPATYFGGTWQRIANGRMLVGVDENDSDFSEARDIGGSKTNSHTHTVTASGTVAGHTLTTSEIPSHIHNLYGNGHALDDGRGGVSQLVTTGIGLGSSWSGPWGISRNFTLDEGGGGSHSHGFTGSESTTSVPNNTDIMNPYFTVYMFEKIA